MHWRSNKRIRISSALFTVALLLFQPVRTHAGERIELQAKDTLSALEMNVGDTLEWTRADGEKWTMVLEETDAGIVERVEPGGIVYRFECRVTINGHAIYFWVGHRFSRTPAKLQGYNGFYLTNGGVAESGPFVRFTPDLPRGRYAVSFREESPFDPNSAFTVRVKHRDGESTLRVRPGEYRHIREFDFDEGMDGYLEILAEEAEGLVIADAVRFRHIDAD